MNRIWLCISLTIVAGTLAAQNLSGSWQGTLQGKVPQRLILQVVKTQSSGWEATLYRIDQSGEPESVPSVKVSGSELKLGLRDGGACDGMLGADSTEIRGSWTEGQLPPQPVTFQRATKATAWQDLDSEVAPPVTTEDIWIVDPSPRQRAAYRSLNGHWERISPGIMKEVPSISSSSALESRAVAETHYYEAVDCLARNDIGAAIAGFRASLEADPAYADAAHGLLHALKANGQFDEAVAVAEQLIATNPDDILAHTSLSILHQHQGRIAEAEAAATRAKLLGWKHELRKQKDAEGRE
jgi:hypothetical protein